MAGHATSYNFVSQRRQPSPIPPMQWPCGPCGWRDLTLGRDSQTCGCRSFWLRSSLQHDVAPSMETAFCYCGHHACYHDALQPATLSQDVHLAQGHFTRPSSQQSYVPAAQHLQHSLKPPQRPSQSVPPGLGLYTEEDPLRLARTHMTASQRCQGRLDNHRFPQAYGGSQAPTDVTSIAGDTSRASPSRAFSHHVTQQRLLANASPLDTSRLRRPYMADDLAQSATEVATPSQSGTPDFGRADVALANVRGCVEDLSKRFTEAHANIGTQNVTPERNPFGQALRQLDPACSLPQEEIDQQMPLVEKLISHVQELKHIMIKRPGLWSSISDLDKRMDALETMSFSHNSAAEFSEQFEAIDTRLLDMEGKVDELEKYREAKENEDHDAANRAASRLRELESFEGSFCELDDASNTRRRKVSPAQRLKDLERRLAGLENIGGPSPQHPWELEVVFLPWGSAMCGIWHDGDAASQFSKCATEDSATNAAQARSRSATPTKHVQPASRSASLSQVGSEWTGTGPELLCARACAATSGTGGKIYERLRSRGFVRSVPVLSKDARMIHASICDAFGELLHLHTDSEEATLGKDYGQHLFGFQSAFIPLRKVHRSSRLRFLSTPELASSLLWTAEFLDTDVFMKQPSTGLRRLFITTPTAYLHQHACAGWSWQKLRELPRFDVNPSASNQSFSSHKSQVLEGDANEPCWTWDERLDPPVSVNSSFTSNDSFQKNGSSRSHPLSPSASNRTLASARTRPSSSAKSSDNDGPDEETSHGQYWRAPVTPTSDMAPGQSSMRRTASLPVAQTHQSNALHSSTKRQTASFEHASTSATAARLAQAKRHRESQSPNLPTTASQARLNNAVRGRWNMTPRRSHEPGSPSAGFSSDPIRGGTTARAEGNAKPGKRVPTPSAYATPFSNSFAAIRDVSLDGGDTDMDSSEGESEYQDDGDRAEDSDDAATEEFKDSDLVDEEFDDAVMAEEESWEGVAEGREEEDESEDEEMDESP